MMMVVMRMMIMLMIPVSASVALFLRSFVKYLWSVATSSFLVVFGKNPEPETPKTPVSKPETLKSLRFL